MPAGDGVSLPTTIAQMGTVAKAQAQSQATSTPTVPFSEQLANDDIRVERVKETDEATDQKMNPEGRNADKRKRRRLNRKRKELADEDEDRDQDSETDELGILIDLRA